MQYSCASTLFIYYIYYIDAQYKSSRFDKNCGTRQSLEDCTTKLVYQTGSLCGSSSDSPLSAAKQCILAWVSFLFVILATTCNFYEHASD